MKLAEKIVDEMCKSANGLCIIGGHMDLAELTENIEKILMEDEMKKQENAEPKQNKKKKIKWSIDKEWNVTGDGYFFNISDLKTLHFRHEADETYTITLVVGTFIAGMLFGKDKKSAQGIYQFLQKGKFQYYQACKKHEKLHHDTIEKNSRALQEMLKTAKRGYSK